MTPVDKVFEYRTSASFQNLAYQTGPALVGFLYKMKGFRADISTPPARQI
jgi:hypothetical protein